MFYLAEDVMRKRILQLVSTCKLDLIVGPKNVMVPSHILYANDVLIFCKCKISNIKNLISIFKDHVAISGQVVNCGKYFIYGGFMLSSRLNILVDLSGFQKSFIPFIYLGVPLFKGKPKRAFLQPIVDIIINKLASWKGSLLSFTMAWNNICKPIDKDGLRLSSTFKLNEASGLKLARDTLNYANNWASLLREIVIRNNKSITYHVFSSIWSNTKLELNNVLDNSSWCLGDGKSISLWFDNWCGSPLFMDGDALSLIEDYTTNIIMVNVHWDFSKSSTNIPLFIQVRIKNRHIPFDLCMDKICWNIYTNEDLPIKFAYDFKRNRVTLKDCWRWIWSKSVPSSKSFMVWRLLHNKLPTNNQWKIKSFSLPSRCDLCGLAEEKESHLFFNCSYALKLWSWSKNMLNINYTIICWSDI
ncbi:hypothetical protein KIW84_060425 [Lathyrus oleraceus]|uniref:Reverse transcriptase zinc-binding domain-containing protein n=1 Tax=Pisum sativum TaxID=3888 RepID=A0A9D4VZQ4_PEA|nr:hypothetical protein KIW84_060425 [Pisum sativum]